MRPKLSVIMAAYNHERYVAQAIRSVLDQSFADFEFLIVDDGSRDGTPDVAARFSDPRIQFVARQSNRGSAASRNELIERSRGDYIAVQNSDDYWPTDKLAYQVGYLETNPDVAAIFGRARLIDSKGAMLAQTQTVFDQDNRSSALWLRRFFDAGNCLCHPTVVVRRQCQIALGGYDLRYRQLIDLDMWVRLAKKYRLFVSERVLAYLRAHPGSTSNPSGDALTRAQNEQYFIAAGILDGMPKAVLTEGFRDLLVFGDPPSDAHCDIEKALICLKADAKPSYKVLGLQRLYDLLHSPIHRPLLVDDYGIDEHAFHRFSAETDAFRRAAESWRLAKPVRWARRLLRRIPN